MASVHPNTTGGGVAILPFPQFLRPAFSLVNSPFIDLVPPATDFRVGGTFEMNPADFGIPITKAYLYLHRYSSVGALKTTTSYTWNAGSPFPTGVWPADAVGDQYVLGCVGVDIAAGGVERVSNQGNEVFSDTVIVISGSTDPKVTSPAVITTPGNTTVAGAVITVAGYAFSGTPTPTPLIKWYLDGNEIAGQTGTTLTTNAAVSGTYRAKVYASGFESSAFTQSNSISLVSATVTQPAYIARSQVKVIETSTVDVIGTRDIKVGVDAGGAAISIPTGWTAFVVTATSAPNLNATIIASGTGRNQIDSSGSDTFARSAEYPVGTVVQTIVGIQHDASGDRFYLTNPADTVTLGGTAYPYPAIQIAGVDTPPVTALTPIEAMGDPSDNFKTVAIAGDICQANTANDGMLNTYSANSMLALGLAILKGDTGAARDRAIVQAKSMLGTDKKKTFFNRGGFSDNVCVMGSFLLFAIKKVPSAWALLNVEPTAGAGYTFQDRANDHMTVAAFSGVYAMSDTAARNGSTICGWPTKDPGSKGENQKKTAPNQSLMGACHYLVCLAYFGGSAGIKTILAKSVPTVRASLVAHGMEDTNLHDTVNWAQLGRTSPIGLAVGGKSSDAPTDSEIQTAIRGNPKWWGYDILTDYQTILAMLTFMRPTPATGTRPDHSPWVANGFYNDGKYSGWNANGYNINGNPVVIARGWGGAGLNSAGDPVASGATEGCLWPETRPDPPFKGLVGTPTELVAWQDGSGKRASPSYSIEGMRPVVSAWAALWVAELLDRDNPDILYVLPFMHRAVLVMEYAFDGWRSWSSTTKADFPQSDWQIGNLFESWSEVIGPALGCGQVVKNGGFGSTNYWTLDAGAAISGGKLVLTAVAIGKGASQSVPLIPNKYYELKYTATGHSAGTFRASLTGGTAVDGATQTANGTFTQRLRANVNNNALHFNAVSAATVTLDSVTLTGPYETATNGGN